MPAVDLLGEFRSAVKDIRGERTTQDVIKPVTKRTVFESDARQQVCFFGPDRPVANQPDV